jgi:hypothetical protein
MSGGLDVLSARVAFRDRGLLDVLDLALRFLAVQARSYAKVSLVVLVPGFALSWLAAEEWGWIGGWFVALLLAWFAQIPFTVLASRLVFQSEVRARDVLRTSLSDLPRLIGVRILWLLAIGVTGAMFGIPALWPLTVLLFTDEVSLLERAGGVRALSRSQRIAAGGRGDAFVMVFLLLLIVSTATLLADFGGRAIIGDLLQFRSPRPFWIEGGSALCLVGLFGIVPYVATARFFTYLNIRTRAEGWDIQTRFAAIAHRAERERESIV